MRKYITYLFDMTMPFIAWAMAFWFRDNLSFIQTKTDNLALTYFSVFFMAYLFSWLYYGLGRGVWRYTSIEDFKKILKVVLVATFVATVILSLYNRMAGLPRSILPLYAIFLTTLLAGGRLAWRMLVEMTFNRTKQNSVLIIGAGSGGESLVRDIKRNASQRYSPIGLLDDDKRKIGNEIHGVKVYGPVNNLVQIAKRLDAKLIIIAIPSADVNQVRHIVELCEETHIPFRTLPSLADITHGRVRIDDLREVSLEDLMGRDEVAIDEERLTEQVTNKTVLVTGAGGSIGSEV